MGNICRSPTAHGVFQNLVEQSGLAKHITIDSAGTHSYHIGKKPDSRALKYAAKRGYDLSNLRARQVEQSDLEKFDYVLAMDSENYMDLLGQSKPEQQVKIKYFLEFISDASSIDVPDPYYGGDKGFELVLDLVEEASKGLLSYLKDTYL